MQTLFLLFILNLACHGTAVRNTISTMGANNSEKSEVSKSRDGSLVVHTLNSNKFYINTKGGECDTLKTELVELKADLQDTKKKLQDTTTGLESATKEIQDTKRRLQDSKTEFQNRKKELQEIKSSLQAKIAKLQSGSTFIRWGRTNCTENSGLVYSGVAGGSWFGHTGAAVNGLCLTLSPQWDGTAKPPYYALLYGAEYQDIHGHIDNDVPCSVCHTPQSATIMVPATLTCPPGWTSQYTGHLTAGRYSHTAASEYLCLDGHPEDMPGGYENRNGYLFYYTLANCGILHCPPYIQDRVVTCVVCSK